MCQLRSRTVSGQPSLVGDFQTLCTIRADISAAPLRKLRGDAGEVSYTREYEVVLLVGLTELKAQVAWTDSVSVSFKGVPTRSALA